MKRFLSAISIQLFLASIIAVPVYAAKPNNSRGKPDNGTSSPSSIGYDVSYPQCGRNLPNDFAFAIVGVNGGLATTYNDCLPQQLHWAQQANGSTAQEKVQLYVNTGNPWDDRIAYKVTTWPTDNIDQRGIDTNISKENPYGVCTTTTDPNVYRGYVNTKACSWQYGWERAYDDVNVHFKKGTAESNVSQNPLDYKWWLDVETTNSWQALDPNAKELNKITLEGMVDYFTLHHNLDIGIYSTNYQFGYIVGDTVTQSSNLYGLDSWLAGARNEKDATSRCSSTPLTPTSKISLVQYVSKNLDHNVSCI